AGVALSGAASIDQARLDRVRSRHLGQQPPRQVLPAHRRWAEAAGRRDLEVGADGARDRAGAAAGMTWRRRGGLGDRDQDIRDHLARETEANLARGMTPDAAAAAARRAFGNIALTIEATRAVWVPIWVDRCGQDVGYAVRSFLRAPG